jgi:hypothetical protein
MAYVDGQFKLCFLICRAHVNGEELKEDIIEVIN